VSFKLRPLMHVSVVPCYFFNLNVLFPPFTIIVFVLNSVMLLLLLTLETVFHMS